MCFFYGWTDKYLKGLDIDTFEDYWLAITCIEAQEMLKAFDVSAWPTMKKSQREKLHKALFKKAYPASFKRAKQVSNDDLAKILSGG